MYQGMVVQEFKSNRANNELTSTESLEKTERKCV